jgi:hypothetical protein
MCRQQFLPITLSLSKVKIPEKEKCPNNLLRLRPACTDRVSPEILNKAKIG